MTAMTTSKRFGWIYI